MTLRITIDIYSGLPNPVVELRGKDAQRALERLRPVRRLEKGEKGLPREPTLGYRGLIIEQIGEVSAGLPRVFRLAHGDLFGPRLAHRAADEMFEDFVCGTEQIRQLELGKKFPDFVKQEIERFKDVRLKWPSKPRTRPTKTPCRCAPLYEPAWWNDGGQKQWHNNCYNYATNYRTDTFQVTLDGSQPGAAAGAIYSALTCASVRPAAVADGLIASSTTSNKCPKEGHLVALVTSGGDFHWYRKGRNGYWTHKPGGSPVTNVDNSGAGIPDPRSADRGPYTAFCTFMVVMHGHIKVK